MSLGLKMVDQRLRSETVDSRDPQSTQIADFTKSCSQRAMILRVCDPERGRR